MIRGERLKERKGVQRNALRMMKKHPSTIPNRRKTNDEKSITKGW